MKKRIKPIAVLLATTVLITMFSMFPFHAYAVEMHQITVGVASGTTGSCTWTLDDDGLLTISGYGATGDINYPFKAPWGDGVKKVVVKDGVTTIGRFLFFKNQTVETVTLPSTVTTIGYKAFYQCEKLSEINLPDNLLSIKESAFAWCRSLKSILIPNSVTELGPNAFGGCSTLETLEIGQGLTVLNGSVFSYCNSLRDVVIPSNIQEIKSEAFGFCDNLETVLIPESVVHFYHFPDDWTGGELPTDYGDEPGGVSLPYIDGLDMDYYQDIEGWDTYNYADVFYYSPKVTILGQPESRAYWYAQAYEIPFVSLSNAQAEIIVKDDTGTVIEDGCTVNWYRKDANVPVATGNKLYNMEENTDYAYEIELGEELSYLYKQPAKQILAADAEEKTITVHLEKIGTAALSGTVFSEDNQPLRSVSVILKQKFNKYEKETVLSVNEHGEFSSVVANVPTKAVFSADGYYGFAVTVIMDEAEQTAIELGKVTLAKLPENRVNLNLTKTIAALTNQEKTVETIRSANGLAFSIFNQTKNKAIDNFTVRYPTVFFGDSEVDGNDVIQIEIADESNSFSPVKQTVKLDAQKTGSCTMRLTENGRFTVPTIRGSERTTIMLFNSKGDYISSASADSDYTSDPLAAGNYKAVLIQKTALLRSVSSLAQLSEYGLTENTDFIVRDIPITAGVITDVGAVTIPRLDESKLYYTVPENTMLTAGNATPYVGRYVVMRCAYEISDKYPCSEETICINLPDKVEFVNGSLTLDGKVGTYTKKDSTIEIKTNKRKGVVRFYVVATENGKKDINATLSFSLGNSTVVQPIGTAAFAATAGNISVPKKSGKTKVTVTGTTMANSNVKVYDNGVSVGTAVSNKVGSWCLTFDLVKPYSFSYHQIFAEITNNLIAGTATTDTKILNYDSQFCEVSKVTMINTAHPANAIYPTEFCTEFDYLHPDTVIPSYNYWPNYPTFTFLVSFTGGDGTSLSNVYVITTDSAGDQTYIPCSYDASTGNWVGTHDFTTFSDVPVSVSTGFDQLNPEHNIGKEELLGKIKDGQYHYTNSKEVKIIDADENEYSIGEEKVKLSSSDEFLADFVPDDSFEVLETEGFQFWSKTTTTDNKTTMTIVMPVASAKEYVSVIENEAVEKLISDKTEGFVKLCFEMKTESDPKTSDAVGACLPTNTWIDKHMDVPTEDERTAERWGDVISLRAKLEAVCECDPTDMAEQLYENLNDLAQSYFDVISVIEAGNALLDLLENVGERTHNQNLERGSQVGQLVLEFTATLFDVGFYSGLTGIAKHASDLKKVTCPDPKPEPDEPKPVKPIADPSGYVYEAVPSNRVEGVKAEAYYYDYATDDFGVLEDDKSDILWDAENYNQLNPLYTDANGEYAWDVPVGQWLVKFSKEGYYDTDTKILAVADQDGYLPVPPPQTEVNVGIVSKATPEVKEVSFFDSEIRLAFSQYMKPETVNGDNVKVNVGDNTVTGTIVPLNEEYDYEHKNQYASVFSFKPAQKLTGSVAVTVNGSVNYANMPMAKAYTQNGIVSAKPESINVKDELNVAYNSGALLEADVLPVEAGSGLIIDVINSSPSIIDTANTNIVTDKNGHANIMVLGKLPGQGELTLSVRGTDITKTVNVNVGAVVPVNDRCEKVTANIASGSTVQPGTLLTFNTKTEGAEIYYTLDGTCPCSLDNPARIKYTGPISLNEDTFIIAYAVNGTLKESYTAGFNYFVEKPSAVLGDVNDDGQVNIIDVTLIQRYIAEYGVPNPDIIQKCGDVDGNGEISIIDVTFIQRYIAEYEVPYPIGKV